MLVIITSYIGDYTYTFHYIMYMYVMKYTYIEIYTFHLAKPLSLDFLISNYL